MFFVECHARMKTNVIIGPQLFTLIVDFYIFFSSAETAVTVVLVCVALRLNTFTEGRDHYFLMGLTTSSWAGSRISRNPVSRRTRPQDQSLTRWPHVVRLPVLCFSPIFPCTRSSVVWLLLMLYLLYIYKGHICASVGNVQHGWTLKHSSLKQECDDMTP